MGLCCSIIGAAGTGVAHTGLRQMAPVLAPAAAPCGVTQRRCWAAAEWIKEKTATWWAKLRLFPTCLGKQESSENVNSTFGCTWRYQVVVWVAVGSQDLDTSQRWHWARLDHQFHWHQLPCMTEPHPREELYLWVSKEPKIPHKIWHSVRYASTGGLYSDDLLV